MAAIRHMRISEYTGGNSNLNAQICGIKIPGRFAACEHELNSEEILQNVSWTKTNVLHGSLALWMYVLKPMCDIYIYIHMFWHVFL